MKKVFDLLFDFLTSAIVDLREGTLSLQQVQGLINKIEDKEIQKAVRKIISLSPVYGE